ncbi:MAG TPA: hypothetical protein VN688_18060 [Gemmataceae bacterium]|nr:hypothetical protein [Gemmataceae bacterium]
MDYDLICSWLGLPPGGWPPDHYRLLGLEPGEGNAEVIEQRVHQRLDCVRRYQMMHPEQATEAMNRLAQAFICLMEPLTKKAYDVTLGVVPPVEPTTTVPQSPRPETLDWLYTQPPVAFPVEPAPVRDSGTAAPFAIPTPPPLPATSVLDYAAAPPPALRLPPPLPPLPLPVEADPAVPPQAIPLAPPPVVVPPSEPVDSVLEAARSGPARRGIATKRALYHRIGRTRHLLRVWTDLGKYISSPKRRLSRSADGPELVRLLDECTVLLKKFPPLLGEAGQPGYLVLALTQVDTIKIFQSFSPHQREALARDWRAAIKLLTAHRDFLREEVRALRQRPFRQRLFLATWSLIVDQPGTVLFLLALLALNVALWRTYAEALWEKLFTR